MKCVLLHLAGFLNSGLSEVCSTCARFSGTALAIKLAFRMDLAIFVLWPVLDKVSRLLAHHFGGAELF